MESNGNGVFDRGWDEAKFGLLQSSRGPQIETTAAAAAAAGNPKNGGAGASPRNDKPLDPQG